MTIKELTNLAVGVSSFQVTNDPIINDGVEQGKFWTQYDPYNPLHRATMGNTEVKQFEVFPIDDEIGMEIVVEA